MTGQVYGGAGGQGDSFDRGAARVLKLHRRELLGSAAAFVAVATAARAQAVTALPWRPYAGSPPTPVMPGPWLFFDAEEGAAVEALVDRLIPPDPDTPGGKDAGCAVFIDRQLAGPYGRQARPLRRARRSSRARSSRARRTRTPAEHISQGARGARPIIAARTRGEAFAELTDADKDEIISGLESGAVKLDGVDGQAFFELLLQGHAGGLFRRSRSMAAIATCAPGR